MKIKSILALAFTLPLVACGSKGAGPKEITREEAASRAEGYTVTGVVDNCGEYFIYSWKATISNKKGVFAQYTDEEIYDDLIGEQAYLVEEESDWVVASSEYVLSCKDTEEESYKFYPSGKNGLIIKVTRCGAEYYSIFSTTYSVITNEDSKATYGEYGQMVKWYGEYHYEINPEAYPEGDVSGSFSMKFSETYKYTNTPPEIF